MVCSRGPYILPAVSSACGSSSFSVFMKNTRFNSVYCGISSVIMSFTMLASGL